MFGSQQWGYSSGGGYTIDQSLRFEPDTYGASYLSWTPSSAGNRRTWTWSAWFKRANSASTHMLFFTAIPSDLTEDDHFGIRIDSGSSSNVVLTWGDGNIAVTNAIFRDPSAWMHIVVAIDTTQATATDRVKVYINGTQQTFSSTDLPSQNWEYGINKAQEHNLGSRTVYGSSGNYFEGNLAEVHFIDGQALDATDFGETGTYGEWKPIEYAGTYGTNGFYLPFKQDYEVEGFSTTLYTGAGSNSVGTHYIGGVGFRPDLVWIKDRESTYQHVLFDSVRGPGRRAIQSNGTAGEGMPNNSYDRLVAFDTDGFTHHGGQYGSGYVDRGGADYVAWCWDMGGRNTVTGFGTTTWTGDGQQQLITGIGFQPDLVWCKKRNGTTNHLLFDSVRGVNKSLNSNATAVEDTSSTNKLIRFHPDGFTIGNNASINTIDDTYVAYGWDMGGTSVTNTDGSITSTVRANPTYGQSIVSFTGTGSAGDTIGHGLSSAPEMVIVKKLDATENWNVYHSGLGAEYGLRLNSDVAAADSDTFYNDTAPTSSVVTLGNNETNTSGNDFIAYCFHSVSGYSKFGSYTGNGGSSDQTITLGFRPAFIMFKRTDSTNNWAIYDSTRQPVTNDLNSNLYADLSNAEGTNNDWGVITDTGFILQEDIGIANENGGTYVYMAFAGGQDTIADFNSDGTIYSRVRANPTYGQSIVSYTGNGTAGATYGHGLSSAPELIMTKLRGTADWLVYDDTNGATKYLQLNSDNPSQLGSGAWNNTAPTSSVVTIGSAGTCNTSGSNYISYCFHSVTGYSKFGSYSGSGSTGNAITTGFQPVFVMLKRTDSANDWIMIDNLRADVSGTDDNELHANATIAEQNDERLDFTSTGFTLKSGAAAVNASGGTYIYMAFADTREYGFWLDQSGNNNDWEIPEGNLDENDISVDSPTNNFATLNPLSRNHTYVGTLYEGNLRQTNAGGSLATMSMPSGKWYWECFCEQGTNWIVAGIIDDVEANTGSVPGAANPTHGVQWNSNSGYIYKDGTQVDTFSTWTTGDILGFAYDQSTLSITFYKNGVEEGSITASTPVGDYTHQMANPNGTGYMRVNFGQDSSFAGKVAAQGNQDSNDIGDFFYTPPTGYLALCTQNLPDPDVIPSKHFNTVIWSGDGTSSRGITGVGFQPDLVWGKNRSDPDSHNLVDAVRGTTKYLYGNAASTEVTDTDRLLSFDSDGFTIGSDLSWNDSNPHTYVAWNWKAGNGTSSNSDGSITSTVSVNSDAGFSIVSFTAGNQADTIGHGLSQTPNLIILKNRDNDYNWSVYHSTQGNTGRGVLNNNDSWYDASSFWNDTSPSSSVFTIGSHVEFGGSTSNMIAYCFHSVDGFSKVGTYTGNGQTDGTFVYTGFRPAFVMVKSTTSTHDWVMEDNTRSNYNPADEYVIANDSQVESSNTYNMTDFLSNGFKLRDTQNGMNGSNTYIYIAFAENPFKHTNAR